MSVRISKPPVKPLQIMGKLAQHWGDAEVAAFITKANTGYYYWDELRHRPPPAGLTPEDAWHLVKMSRWNVKHLPLSDPKGLSFKYWLPDLAYQILHSIDRKGGGALAFDSSDPQILPEMQDRVL